MHEDGRLDGLNGFVSVSRLTVHPRVHELQTRRGTSNISSTRPRLENGKHRAAPIANCANAFRMASPTRAYHPTESRP